MAGQTRGYSQYVLPQEKLELSMSSFWGKVQDPIIAGIKVVMGSVTALKVYPKDMPDLFKGDQLVVFGSYDKPGKSAVTLTGMVNGTEQKFVQDVNFEEKTDSSKEWIAKLWATRRVGYLLDEIRLHGENKELKDEVVDLARKWGVVTPYTAMLIIEDERARGVPLAMQSLREMQYDEFAAVNAAGVRDSMRRGDVAGSGIAVSNGINANQMKSINSLDMSQQVFEQRSAHGQLADAADALRKDAAATPANSAATETLGGQIAMSGGTLNGGFGGGGMGGAGGGRAGRGGGGYVSGFTGGGAVGGRPGTPTVVAEAPRVQQQDLNLGNQTANGWQAAGTDKTKAEGYRMISNYAQQTRVVNNRSFFLNGNQWTDVNAQNVAKTATHVKVVFGSETYFDLLAKHPEAGPYLSLGNNVTIELDGKIYDIVEEALAGK